MTPEALCRRCDPSALPFETTEALTPLTDPIGQARAVAAVRFGIGMRQEGYNLFAMGPRQADASAVVLAFLEERAKGEPVPGDICYVHDFEHPHRPRVLYLAPGQGQELRADLSHLVEDLRTSLPAAFESEEFSAQKIKLEHELKARQEAAFEEKRERAAARGVAVLRSPTGFVLAALHDGEVVAPDDFEKIPEPERERIAKEADAMHEELHELVERLRGMEKETRDKLRALIRSVAVAAVGHLIEEVRRKWAGHTGVEAHLDELRQDVLDNVDDFLKPVEAPSELAMLGIPSTRERFRRYGVNVLVDNGAQHGAPVVYERNPAFQNLVGRVDHLQQLGALVTDFQMIKAGALHRANGGYLMIDALDLLRQPFGYEGLKRALRSSEIRIEALGQMLGLVSTVTLEPEPMALSVKVVLVGERILYYLLSEHDPDFAPLFKVMVDFEDSLDRTAETDLLFARFIAGVAKRDGLRPFRRDAVARVLERAARIADDACKLTAHTTAVADLLREADWYAKEGAEAVVTGAHVQQAIDAQQQRAGRIRERTLEAIRRGTLMVETQGKRVGQVNGLSVLELSGFAFGRPSRITARVRMGKGDVVDIEREVELGGPIHSKGVLILSSFLGSRFATNHPLSLTASIVFEQSYGPVEGDSASCAELCALLSTLAEVPIDQSIAITGSIDQHGRVQPIGGVNEKVEGFLAACREQGLSDRQGVIVPSTNRDHLMLSREVLDAVREDRFRVWAVSTVDEAMEVLTGLPAGERDASGTFPEGTLNQKVEARLIALAERRIALGKESEKGSGK